MKAEKTEKAEATETAEATEKTQAPAKATTGAKVKKTFGIIGNVLLYVFLAFCVVLVFFVIGAQRSEDGAVNVFGYEARIVLTGSMEKDEKFDVSKYKIKSIPTGSLIVTQCVPTDEEKADKWYAALKVGDVLTFQYDPRLLGDDDADGKIVTHRIIKIEEWGEGYRIVLRGDKNAESAAEQIIYTVDETETSINYVIGKVVFTNLPLGLLLSVLKQDVGIALIIIVPAAIIMIWQIIRIVAVLTEEKRSRTAKSVKEKENEIELLKQRLAALENTQSPPEKAEESPQAPPEETASEAPMSEDAPSEKPESEGQTPPESTNAPEETSEETSKDPEDVLSPDISDSSDMEKDDLSGEAPFEEAREESPDEEASAPEATSQDAPSEQPAPEEAQQDFGSNGDLPSPNINKEESKE